MSLSTRRLLVLNLCLITIATPARASPVALMKRSASLTPGATAGLAMGIAVAVLISIVVLTLLIIHFRARSHHDQGDDVGTVSQKKTRNSVATTITNDNVTPRIGEKQSFHVEATSPTAPAPPAHRHKSLKDRLLGPLYRDSMIDTLSQPVTAHTRRSRVMGGDAEDVDKTDSQLELEYNASKQPRQRDTVQSFSSRRVTRLMMMM